MHTNHVDEPEPEETRPPPEQKDEGRDRWWLVRGLAATLAPAIFFVTLCFVVGRPYLPPTTPAGWAAVPWMAIFAGGGAVGAGRGRWFLRSGVVGVVSGALVALAWYLVWRGGLPPIYAARYMVAAVGSSLLGGAIAGSVLNLADRKPKARTLGWAIAAAPAVAMLPALLPATGWEHLTAASAYAKWGIGEAAAQELDSLAWEDTSPDQMVRASELWLTIGRAAAALEWADRAAESAYGKAEWEAVGDLYRRLGQDDLAAIQYRLVALAEPPERDERYVAGAYLLAKGLWRQAAQHLQEAANNAASRQDRLDARSDLGVCLKRLGFAADAVGEWEKVKEADPKHLKARWNLALTYQEFEMFGMAESEYRAVLALKPDDIDARYNLAVVLARLGRKQDAAAQLDLVLKQDPNHQGAKQLRGQL